MFYKLVQNKREFRLETIECTSKNFVALGIVTPWGGAMAPLQEPRGCAAGAHGGLAI